MEIRDVLLRDMGIMYQVEPDAEAICRQILNGNLSVVIDFPMNKGQVALLSATIKLIALTQFDKRIDVGSYYISSLQSWGFKCL